MRDHIQRVSVHQRNVPVFDLAMKRLAGTLDSVLVSVVSLVYCEGERLILR
ncbi:hypothetical protein SDC9_194092 [bioreactor metagenome]|uniref:Uncharacterized protein n=1 Tax=bioreactor metagenome TaxID=1076179 RepID=A0A645I6I5_9ZZZZ